MCVYYIATGGVKEQLIARDAQQATVAERVDDILRSEPFLDHVAVSGRDDEDGDTQSSELLQQLHRTRSGGNARIRWR